MHTRHPLLQAILPLAIALILATPRPLPAAMRRVNKIRAGIPPFEVMRAVTRANSQSLRRDPLPPPSKYTPWLTWLTAPAPELRRERIIPAAKEICEVRNPGALLENNAAAVDYGVRVLHTPVLLITLNSDNEAVRAVLGGLKTVSPELRRELSPMLAALPGITPPVRATAAVMKKDVEAVVDFQVDLAMARYRDRVRAGRLVVVGSVLDTANRYRRGRGRLIIINVNGETGTKKIATHQAIRRIDPALAPLCLGRETAAPSKKGRKKTK